jgi:phosphomannomutase
MPQGWVHLRKSNTEPIIRLYAEAGSQKEAEGIATEAMQTVNELIK